MNEADWAEIEQWLRLDRIDTDLKDDWAKPELQTNHYSHALKDYDCQSLPSLKLTFLFPPTRHGNRPAKTNRQKALDHTSIFYGAILTPAKSDLYPRGH